MCSDPAADQRRQDLQRLRQRAARGSDADLTRRIPPTRGPSDPVSLTQPERMPLTGRPARCHVNFDGDWRRGQGRACVSPPRPAREKGEARRETGRGRGRREGATGLLADGADARRRLPRPRAGPRLMGPKGGRGWSKASILMGPVEAARAAVAARQRRRRGARSPVEGRRATRKRRNAQERRAHQTGQRSRSSSSLGSPEPALAPLRRRSTARPEPSRHRFPYRPQLP